MKREVAYEMGEIFAETATGRTGDGRQRQLRRLREQRRLALPAAGRRGASATAGGRGCGGNFHEERLPPMDDGSRAAMMGSEWDGAILEQFMTIDALPDSFLPCPIEN